MTNDKPKKPLGTVGLIAALGGVVTVAVTVATAVHGWWQGRRELELQERQQLQQLRMAYMNVMVDGGFERVEMVADFIAETEQDSKIREWAENQRKKAGETATKVRAQAEDQRKSLAEAEKARVEAEKRASQAEAEARRLAEQAGADQKKREEAEKAAKIADEARGKLANATADTRIRDARLTRLNETLQGTQRVELKFEQLQRPKPTPP
jgi:hypothetical protein